MTLFLKSDTPVDSAAVVGNYGVIANAVIDLNYESGVLWYNGRYYASVDAIIAAGFGNNTGGIQRLTLPALQSEFTIFAKAVCGAVGAKYIFSLDDGSDSVPGDNLIAISQNPGDSAGPICLASSVNQLNDTGTTTFLTNGGLEGAKLSVAMRIKANDFAISYSGTAVKTDSTMAIPVGLLNMVIGNRDDGLRAWTGTIQHLAIINRALTNAELVALSI